MMRVILMGGPLDGQQTTIDPHLWASWPKVVVFPYQRGGTFSHTSDVDPRARGSVTFPYYSVPLNYSGGTVFDSSPVLKAAYSFRSGTRWVAEDTLNMISNEPVEMFYEPAHSRP